MNIKNKANFLYLAKQQRNFKKYDSNVCRHCTNEHKKQHIIKKIFSVLKLIS